MAAATLTTEAVSPSPAVFFATHAPLRIYRSPGRQTAGRPGMPVNEEEVRDDFLTRRRPAAILLMPVIGQSGTGKSHLVRWIKEKTPSTDKREVIYLPQDPTPASRPWSRPCSPRSRSANWTNCKADVDRMSSELDQEGLEQRLLNQLHEALAAARESRPSAHRLSGDERTRGPAPGSSCP